MKDLKNFEFGTIKRSQIKFADYNPRKIDKSNQDKLINAIKDHGLIEPVVWNQRTGVLVGGHQRLTAADMIYNSKDYDVPVAIIDVDERTEKKLNVQLNNPSMQGSWDLDELLKLSTDVSFGDMGFDRSDIEDMFDGQVDFDGNFISDDDLTDLTDDQDNDGSKFEPSFQNAQKALFEGVGDFDIPEIKGVDHIDPVDWISFNMLKTYDSDQPFGVHHFIDDYQFEREWTHVDTQVERLKRAKYVTSPDFSLYMDFPKALQIFNHYRKHWIAAYFEQNGIQVIPTIAWSDEDSWAWCFDGEPVNKPVAISSVGVMNSEQTKDAFLAGYNKMIEVLNPPQILYYGEMLPELEDDSTIIRLDSFTTQLRKRVNN